jgi:imidazole glycerol-phosphate synthase subunit HisH
MKVLLFDYGTGNLHSLRKALALHGASVVVGTELDGAGALVLPGVGAFGAAAERLRPYRDRIRDAAGQGLPVLGICLGMQLLLDSSSEGPGRGLGLIPGTVRRLRTRRIPHMGWNAVRQDPGSGLFQGIEHAWFYFANSYVAEPVDSAVIAATATHEGDTFPAILRAGSVVGTQFHPEKSGAAGLRLIGNLLAEVR